MIGETCSQEMNKYKKRFEHGIKKVIVTRKRAIR